MVAGEGSKAEGKLKVAIVSAAWGVVCHLPAWRVLADEVEVVGIMTSREETAVAAARDTGIPRAYWDIATLCADPDIDIVDVGTQPRIRQELVSAVLRAGKHCYSGMPFATDGDWARRLLEEQRQAGVVGMVDATIQAVPAVVRMKEMIAEGAIGRPWFAHASFNQQLFLNPPGGWPYKWFAEKGAGASALRNLGSHALHPMVALLGPIEEVIGHNDRWLDEWRFADGEVLAVNPPDTAHALLRFANGVTATFQTSWVAADGAGWFFEVHGSGGRLRVEGESFPNAEQTHLFYGPAGTAYTPVGGPVEIPERLRTLPNSLLDPAWPDRAQAEARRRGPQDLVMGRMFREMAQAVRHGGAAQPDFAQAFHVQQVVEAICRSQETRAWEAVRG
jgi:predicted dehydrogenase